MLAGIIPVRLGRPAEKILVVAPNYRIFRSWCDMHEINFRSTNVKFIGTESDLQGYKNVWFVNLGTDNGPLNDRVRMMVKMGQLKSLADQES